MNNADLKDIAILPDDLLASILRSSINGHLEVVSENTGCDQTMGSIETADAFITIGIINKER